MCIGSRLLHVVVDAVQDGALVDDQHRQVLHDLPQVGDGLQDVAHFAVALLGNCVGAVHTQRLPVNADVGLRRRCRAINSQDMHNQQPKLLQAPLCVSFGQRQAWLDAAHCVPCTGHLPVVVVVADEIGS